MEKDNKSRKTEKLEKIAMFVGIFIAAYCVMNAMIPGVILGIGFIVLAVVLAERRTKKNKDE